MSYGYVWSGLTGLALAPLVASFGHLALEVTATGSGARLLCALAVGGSAALLGRTPRPQRARPLAALTCLALAALLVAALLAGAPRVPAAALALPVALAVLGVAVAGGGMPRGPGPLLLGWAAGSIALEAWVLPVVGFLPPLVLGVVLLPFVAGRVPESSLHAGPARGLLDLALLGVLGAALLELARPYLLQHLSGARSSHAGLAIVLLVGLGLGSLLPVPRRLRPTARFVVPLLFLGGIVLTWRTLLGLRGGPILPGEDLRLVELQITQIGIGVLALAAGWWLKVGWVVVAASGVSRPVCAGLAAVLLGSSLGLAGTRSLLARQAELPQPVASVLDALIRRNSHELLGDRVTTADGVLRRTRDIGHPEHGEGLAWHARRATRVPAFAALEETELLFAGRLAPEGGRLLVIGSLSDAHGAALEQGHFESVTVRPVLPPLDAFENVAEGRLDDDGFDAAVVLASPFLSREAARPLSATRLAALARRSRVLLVWFDLRALDLRAVAATARALQGTADDVRAWIALDGYVGPLLALSAGGARDGDVDGLGAVVRPFPLSGLPPGPTAGAWFPVAELTARLEHVRRTLAPGPALEQLAQTAREADQGALSGLLDALAIHAREYYDVVMTIEVHERQRLTDEEVDVLARVAARAPEDPLVIHQLRAFAELAYEKAEYERLLAGVGPLLDRINDPQLLSYAAKTHFQLLDDSSAIELLERAQASGLNDTATLVLLGRAYTRAGDTISASAVLDEARAQQPTDTRTCRSLGLAYYEVGRGIDALPYLEGFAARHPEDTEIQALLETLR